MNRYCNKEKLEKILNLTVVELKKNWKGIEKEKREKSLNRKGEKIQEEKENKSPNRKGI